MCYCTEVIQTSPSLEAYAPHIWGGYKPIQPEKTILHITYKHAIYYTTQFGFDHR